MIPLIRIQNLRLPIDGTPEQLRAKAARLLGIRPSQITQLSLARQSIDARRKSDVHYVCAVNLSAPGEEGLVRRAASPNVTLIQPRPYVFPAVERRSPLRPVVVGMGPAGLFCALFLARSGLPPLILERGRPVEERVADVERFWAAGALDPRSNVQFGEGGAGTFSDGKLTTGIHDPRVSTVLAELAAAGAPADIQWQHKPHIGTDVLRQVVAALRRTLLDLGCEIRFGHRLDGLVVKNGALAALRAEGPQGCYEEPCDALVLAPGHSARDTFAMLRDAGVAMAAKAFAIGVRIEHSQAAISRQQFGPAWERLPAADYKLSCHLPGGRSAYTFCVCPGGQVVAAASEPGGLVTNGMSCRARDGANINGGFLVGVTPADFPGDDVLSGVRFQETWERAAWALGTGNAPPVFAPDHPVFHAPAQRAADFLARRPSEGPGAVLPTYRPGVTWTELDSCLPPYVADTLRGALPLLDRKLRGFADPDAVLTGVETRSSSPVRILRDESLQSALRGLYPCGEGAGYAGGIVSAAVDGIRVAEAVAGGRGKSEE